MGLRRTMHANRKEILVALILVGVFMFDFSKEIEEPEGISNNNPRMQALETTTEDPAIKDLVIASFQGDVGNLTTVVMNKAKLVVYNRVPKCGSQTMSMLINHCSRRNKFKSKQVFQNGEVPNRSYGEQIAFIKELQQDLVEMKPKDKPLLFTRHQYFIDFEAHNFQAPVYMNMIRDPVDRFASFYYFSRYGNARSGLKKAPPNHMTMDVWNESIDDCVAKHRRECTNPIWHTVPYLCGNSGVCQEQSDRAIQETKRNIERNYFTIGVIEDFKTFLKLLQKVLPQYFDGALEIYEANNIRNDTYTLNKKTIQDKTRTWLETMTPLTLEYEVYHFVRARFRAQAQKLDLI